MQIRNRFNKQHVLALYITLYLGITVVSLLINPRGAHAQSTDDWQLRLERLRVVDAQEEGCILFICSDGDEPYFVAIKLYAGYDAPDSANVSWGEYVEERWANGVDDGDEREIPAEMGLVTFPNVEILTRDDVSCRDAKPEGGGVLIIAMEHDGTPWSTIRRIMNDLQSAINQELTNLVANAELDIDDPEPDIRAAIDRIISNVLPDFWESAEIIIISGGDPDDFIGYHFVILGAGDPRLEDELEVPTNIANTTLTTFKEPHDQINQKPIVFQGGDATYEVTATLKRTSADLDQKTITGLHINDRPTVLVGTTQTFVATVDTGTGVTYDWVWGDGSTSICDSVEHTFDTTGPQTITVTASNTWDSESATVTVNVVEPQSNIFIPLVSSNMISQ